MKEQEDHHSKKKVFIKKPYFPGGKTSFESFIKENLKYPEEALQNKTEGTIFMEYEVDDLGIIGHVNILKGIGHGCDEEAIRLVRLINYPPVRNRGIRVKTKMKTRIQFKLPQETNPGNSPHINISYLPASPKNTVKPDPKTPTKYSYQVKLG